MKRYEQLMRLAVAFGILLIGLLSLESCTCGGSESSKDDDIDDDTDDDDDTNDDDDDDNNTDDDDIAPGWHVYTVDTEGGRQTSIAIDLTNKAHITYTYGADLKYATNKVGSWEISKIGYAVCPQSNRNIEVDHNYKVHIAHCSSSKVEKALQYTTNQSGSWQTFTIASVPGGTTGGYASIALDSNNKVHISYFECGKIDEGGGCVTSDVKYITNKSGSWQKSVIDDLYLVEQEGETLIAVDKDGHVHISYYAQEQGLKYATNASGMWEKFLVDEGPARRNSIAVDSAGKVHIAYKGWCYGACLRYATNASGEWQFSDINMGDCDYPSIALDSHDKVHISYYAEAGEDSGFLRYATNKTGAWEKTTIDLSGDAGWYSSIAVDSDDYIHISYYDGKNKHLKYATNRPPD